MSMSFLERFFKKSIFSQIALVAGVLVAFSSYSQADCAGAKKAGSHGIYITHKSRPYSPTTVTSASSAKFLDVSFDFGGVDIGDSSNNMEWGICWENYEGVSVSTSLSGSSTYTMTSNGCSGSHPGTGDCDITINFTPTVVGTENATSTISYTGTYYEYDEDGNLVLKTESRSFVAHITGAGQNYQPEHQDDCCTGSILRIISRVVQERIPLVGVDFDLYYSSQVAPQYLPDPGGPGFGYVVGFIYDGLGFSIHHNYILSQNRLYTGDGRVESIRPQYLPSGNFLVPSSDGSEVYEFNPYGVHQKTRTFLTGAIKYSFSYDYSGHLVGIDDAYGNHTTITRDSSERITSLTAPYGQETTFTTYSNGYISSVTDPMGNEYQLTYYTVGGTSLLLNTFTKPGGQVSTFTYDANGRMIYDYGNGGNYWHVTDDGLGNISRESALGVETTYSPSYATNGYYTMDKTNSSGLVDTLTEYKNYVKKANSILSQSDYLNSDGRFHESHLKVYQHLTKMGGVTLQTDYGQSVAWPTSPTDPFDFTSITSTETTNSKVSTNVFTKSTMTSVDTSPEGATRTTIYNSHEQPTSIQTGSDTAKTISYDTNGRISQEAQGTHNILNYTYNTAGLLDTVTDALSHVTSYAYDLAGRLTSITLPDSRVIGYSYDDNGNVTSITPPGKPTHGFSFNAFETLDTYSPPTLTGVSVVNTTYSYNNDKQLTLITRPDGKTASFAYDSTTGLLTGLTIDTGSYSYTYKTDSDQLDVVSSPDDFNNTFGWYGYKLKNDAQKQTSTGKLFGKTSLAYDSEHRVTSRTLQERSGATFVRNYSYNDDDQPTQIGDETFTYEYPSGRLSTTTLGTISDARTYDAYGNLATYTAIYTPAVGSPTTLYIYTLTRNLMSQITSMSETVLGTTTVWDYIYDSSGRLSKVKKNSVIYSSYTYDDNGNRTGGKTAGSSFTATYDDQDRILTYNTRTYTYNANGDVIQYGSGGSNTYTFDALGKLKAATTAGGANLVYSLDGLGRRIRKTDGGTFKHQYIYETGDRIAAHVNNSGAIQKEYVYGVENSNVPDYMILGGVNYRIIKDHLGSPRLVVDTTNGTVSQEMDYDDLGNVISDTNPGFQHFGFAGGNYDNQTKLVKFGAREYDARSAGRWMTKDPIRFGGGDTNLYGYVLQDPINLIDPSGLEGRCATDESCNSPIHNTPGGGGGGGGGKPFGPDQRAVVDLAKQAKKTGVERCEAETLADWAQQAGLKGQIHDPHEGTNTDYPHAHIGPVDHIRINE